MIMVKKKKIPEFSTEDAERTFWSQADATEYIDWTQSKKIIIPNLTPSQKINKTDTHS